MSVATASSGADAKSLPITSLQVCKRLVLIDYAAGADHLTHRHVGEIKFGNGEVKLNDRNVIQCGDDCAWS